MPDLVPVDHDPFSISFDPVDHNPFAADQDAALEASMTHYAEQPNPAKPYLDAAERFAKGGISGVIGHRDPVGDLLQSDAANTAIGMATPFKAGLGDVLPRNLGVARPDRPINLETMREMQQAPPEALPPGRQVNEQTLAEMRAAQSPPSITAYHGSPHDFDKFDVTKIGTGEGAQAYGHGLYLAENEGVAREYKKLGGAQLFDKAGNEIPLSEGERPLAEMVHEDGIDRVLAEQRADLKRLPQNEVLKSAIESLEKWKEAGVTSKLGGHMYQVAIKADPEHFLDWDKPLSEQSPKTEEALRQIIKQPDFDWKQSGADFVQGLGHDPMGQNAKLMNQAGIPGIKYLDQGSRAVQPNARIATKEEMPALRPDVPPQQLNYPYYVVSDAGHMAGYGTKAEADKALSNTPTKETRNYVVFDDKLVDILKKYGLAGLSALPAAGAYHFRTQQVDHDPFAAKQ